MKKLLSRKKFVSNNEVTAKTNNFQGLEESNFKEEIQKVEKVGISLSNRNVNMILHLRMFFLFNFRYLSYGPRILHVFIPFKIFQYFLAKVLRIEIHIYLLINNKQEHSRIIEWVHGI